MLAHLFLSPWIVKIMEVFVICFLLFRCSFDLLRMLNRNRIRVLEDFALLLEGLERLECLALRGELWDLHLKANNNSFIKNGDWLFLSYHCGFRCSCVSEQYGAAESSSREGISLSCRENVRGMFHRLNSGRCRGNQIDFPDILNMFEHVQFGLLTSIKHVHIILYYICLPLRTTAKTMIMDFKTSQTCLRKFEHVSFDFLHVPFW